MQWFPSVWLLKSHPAKNHFLIRNQHTALPYEAVNGRAQSPPERSINICNSNYTYSGYASADASTAQGAQQVLNFSRSQTKNPATWWCSLFPPFTAHKKPRSFFTMGLNAVWNHILYYRIYTNKHSIEEWWRVRLVFQRSDVQTPAQQVLNFSRSQTKNPATWWCSLFPPFTAHKKPRSFYTMGINTVWNHILY